MMTYDQARLFRGFFFRGEKRERGCKGKTWGALHKAKIFGLKCRKLPVSNWNGFFHPGEEPRFQFQTCDQIGRSKQQRNGAGEANKMDVPLGCRCFLTKKYTVKFR